MSLQTFRPFLPMSALLVLSLGAALAIGSGSASSGERFVAAFFDPGWSAERALLAVAASDAAIVREGALRTILTVHGGGDVKSSLYRHGAWLVVDVPSWACGWRRPSSPS
jgi:hypothetical protein